RERLAIRMWVNLGTARPTVLRRIRAFGMASQITATQRRARGGRAPESGWDELVIVAVDPVAQAPSDRATVDGGDRDRPHDLADAALPAEEIAPFVHPGPDMRFVGMELERPRVDRDRLRPRRGHLGRHDIEEVDPPGNAVDHLEAAVAALGDVVLNDRVEPDPHDLHRRDPSRGAI